MKATVRPVRSGLAVIRLTALRAALVPEAVRAAVAVIRSINFIEYDPVLGLSFTFCWGMRT